MFRPGPWVAACGAALVVWVGSSVGGQEPKPGAPAPDATDAKPVDLAGLREAVAAAAKRGDNVDAIRAALDALEKAAPTARAGRVPAELRALRDAVDAAARKGESVEAIAKELGGVETAIAGKSLARPKPEPQPMPAFPDYEARPFDFDLVVPRNPNPGFAGGIDVELFNRSMELRKKAVELMARNPRDPQALKEVQRLQAEASELMAKAVRGGAGGFGGAFPERPRLGIRLEHVPALAAEQLGLEPNAGLAVALVTPGSVAEKVGLKVHDIVLEFAGKPVTDDAEDFIRRVNEAKAGEKIDLVVLRKGKKVDVKGVELPDLTKRPPPRPFAPAGFGNPIKLPVGFDTVTAYRTDDGFKVMAAKGGAKFVLTGTLDADGRPVLGRAVIDQDGKRQDADDVAKLPADVRADVETLLKTFEPRK
jgi:hypothetical protein